MGSTNTLILSGFANGKLDDKNYIDCLQRKIVSNALNTDTVQFIILKSLKRIILIFDNLESSVKLYQVLREDKSFITGKSIHNYNNNIQDNYLKLPNNSRMFLISPPASPPPDFNYDQEEEEPNKLQIYTPEELKESLLKYNKELEKILRENKNKINESSWNEITEKEIVLNDNKENSNTPKIILHPIKGHNDHLISHAIESFRTSLPARSIFDELDDEEDYNV